MEYFSETANAPPSTLVFVKRWAPAELKFQEGLLALRKPTGLTQDPRLPFEAVSRLHPEEKNVIRSVMESIVLRTTIKPAEQHVSPIESGGNSR